MHLGPPEQGIDNEDCDSAEAVQLAEDTGRVDLSGSLALAGDEVAERGCAQEPGEDAVYRLLVAEPLTLQLGVAGPDGAVSAQLVSGACRGADVELEACVASDGPLVNEVVRRLEVGTYWVIVDRAHADADRYDLVLATFPAPEEPDNDSCDAPLELGWQAQPDGTSVAVAQGNTLLAGDAESGGCGGEGGRDVVFRLPLEDAVSLSIQASPPAWGGVVSYLRTGACTGEEALEVACAEEDGLVFVPSAGPGDVWLVVDTPEGSPGGPFEVSVEARGPVVPADHGTCDTALALAFDDNDRAELTSTTVDAGPNYAGSCGGDGSEQVLHFSLERPRENSVFELDTERWGGWYETLHLRRGPCADGAQVVCETAFWGGPISVDVAHLPPGDYYLFADGDRAADSGIFDLTVQLGPEVQPPANEACASVEAVELDVDDGAVRLTGAVGAAAGDLADGSCAEEWTGRDVVYELQVAEAISLDLAVTSLDPGNAALGVHILGGACEGEEAAELACAVSDEEPASLTVERLDPGSYWLVVDAAAPTADRFALDLTPHLAPVEIDNETCETAAALEWVAGEGDRQTLSVAGNHALAEDDLAGACGGDGGPDAVFSFELDADHSLSIDVGRPAWGGLVVYLLHGACDAEQVELACLQGGETHFLHRVPAGTYRLVVDAVEGAAAGPYELSIEARSPVLPADPDTCADAAPLVFDDDGRLHVLATTAGAGRDYDTSCAGGTGPDTVYTFTVEEARGPASFYMNSEDWTDWDTVLYLRRGPCEDGEEVACNDDGVNGVGTSDFEVDRLEAGDYFLFADGYGQSSAGVFVLDIDLGPVL